MNTHPNPFPGDDPAIFQSLLADVTDRTLTPCPEFIGEIRAAVLRVVDGVGNPEQSQVQQAANLVGLVSLGASTLQPDDDATAPHVGIFTAGPDGTLHPHATHIPQPVDLPPVGDRGDTERVARLFTALWSINAHTAALSRALADICPCGNPDNHIFAPTDLFPGDPIGAWVVRFVNASHVGDRDTAVALFFAAPAATIGSGMLGVLFGQAATMLAKMAATWKGAGAPTITRPWGDQ